MTRPIAVLRPEPGNAATAARIEALGRTAIRLPLFAVRALDWIPPDPAGYDGLLLTSANTTRHGGAGLAALRGLPVLAVGRATAAAARAAGFAVALTGAGGAAALAEEAAARGFSRLLLLGGRERTLAVGGVVAAAMTVYASDVTAMTPDRLAALPGSTALLHSARAARRLGELIPADRRAEIALAAISPAVAHAAGSGWADVAVAAAPDDAALLAAALAD